MYMYSFNITNKVPLEPISHYLLLGGLGGVGSNTPALNLLQSTYWRNKDGITVRISVETNNLLNVKVIMFFFYFFLIKDDQNIGPSYGYAERR